MPDKGENPLKIGRGCIAVFLASLLASAACNAFAAENPPPEEQQRWAVFPIIASNPEVGVMLGGMLFHFFPVEKQGEQASTVDFMVFGTTKGQSSAQLSPNIFFGDGAYRLYMSLTASRWVANFYPIGNDSPDEPEKYRDTIFAWQMLLERRFLDALVLNVGVLWEKNDMTVKSGGILDSGAIEGASDSTFAGVAAEGGYDTRDNTNSPTRGAVARYRFYSFEEAFGSDLDFHIQNLDVRGYLPVGASKTAVAAFGATLRKASGDVPFRYLSSPDGTLLLRGVENGRYRDLDLLGFQSELRFPIHGSISGTVFAEAAQVAPSIGDFHADEFKTSLGSGFRYALNPDQRFNLRADVAWVDNGIGVIVNIREAF